MRERSASVLVAEDMTEMRLLLGMILKEQGYRDIAYAATGPEAEKLSHKRGFQLAFLDIELPGMNGIELVKVLRATLPECFFVMVSAHSEPENVKAALDAGAHGFIVKPYRARQIAEALETYEIFARGRARKARLAPA
jgi:CheY-like chemotaxis protein